MVFTDLEKAYDKVPRDAIWWVLERKSVIKGNIDVVKGMYEGGCRHSCLYPNQYADACACYQLT